MMSRINFLGFHVDNLNFQETLLKIRSIIRNGKPVQHVVLNVNKIIQANKNKKFKQIINSCGLINADGISIIWAVKLLGMSLKERVTGINLMQSLIELATREGYKLYFLGAEEEIIKKVIKFYKSCYPTLQIVGFRDGYWDSSQEQEVVNAIKTTEPDILFVGISSPQKEIFINQYLEEMNVPLAMGVGGSFDVIAGKTKRAPKWMQRCGLEWLFRLYQEPRRLWKRYLIGNIIFVWLVLKEFIKVRILGRQD